VDKQVETFFFQLLKQPPGPSLFIGIRFYLSLYTASVFIWCLLGHLNYNVEVITLSQLGFLFSHLNYNLEVINLSRLELL